ncbi:TolC family protein [Anthocerotibacter panamensis]|uniref:TolC family protein n=1 Tax=Anthocerotibacter panamensis TaxID=2857077 RepID=UPI001C403E50|nr:TolC family protein [Anthocerotibacter panamensis]
MVWKQGLLMGLLLLALGEPLLAQAAAPQPSANFSIRLEREARPMALKEALQTALERNQTVLRARNDIARAEAGLQAAKAAWLPSLSTTSSYSGQQGGGSTLTGGNFTNSVNVQGSVNWTLYDANRQAQIDIAQLSLEQARLNLKTRERDISLRVIGAYYDLQNADSTLAIQESALRVAENNLDLVRKRRRAGVSTQFDVLQQEVQLANSRQQLLAAQNDRARDRLLLADLLNLTQSIPVRTADPVEPGNDYTRSLEATLEEAINRRPELASLERGIELATAQQVAANSQVLPQVTLSTGYGFSDNLRGFNQDQLTVSANLRWTIYDGGASVARQEQFEYDKRNNRLDLTSTAQTIRTDIERAYLSKETAKAQMSSAEVAINQATESLDLARRRQNLGLALQVEVITAERALTDARQNFTNAVIAYNRALAELGLALGVS